MWVYVVFGYYLTRAVFVIYPSWAGQTELQHLTIIVQSLITFIIFITLMCSYKFGTQTMKWLLYLQAFQLSLSNFNHLEADDTNNWDGINTLSAVFSMIFVIYNTFLATFLIESPRIGWFMTLFMVLLCFAEIVAFDIHFDKKLDFYTIKTLIIEFFFILIITPSFVYISNKI